jgi:hypothetical protein
MISAEKQIQPLIFNRFASGAAACNFFYAGFDNFFFVAPLF